MFRNKDTRYLVFVCSLLLLGLISLTFPGPPPRDPCFVAETEFPVRSVQNLPRIVHQQWDGPMREPFASWHNKTKRIFSNNFTHMVWDDRAARDLILKKYAWFLETYDAYPKNIMRVDAARTFILFEHGGMYLDMDYEPLVDFWNRIPDDAPSFVQSYWAGYEERQNSLMLSPPKHPFWKAAWEVMMERKHQTNPITATGPAMIDEAVVRYYGDTHMLSCENWHRPAVGEAGKHTSLKHRTWRGFAHSMGWFRKCGSVEDPRCHFGIHHSTITWNLR